MKFNGIVGRTVLFLASAFFVVVRVAAVNYSFTGNNTTRYVTGQPTVTTAAKGFVYFTGGAIFSGTVNIALPVPLEGNVQFGSGTTCALVLEQDLTLGTTASNSVNRMQINTSTGSVDVNGGGGYNFFEF